MEVEEGGVCPGGPTSVPLSTDRVRSRKKARFFITQGGARVGGADI